MSRRVLTQSGPGSRQGLWFMGQLADGDAHLPDPHPRLGLEVEPLPRPHVERVVPCIDVADGGDAVALRGVAVRGELGAQRLLATLAAPASREPDEELPVLLPDVCLVGGFGAEGSAVGVEGRGKAGQVGNVLGLGQLAVDGQVGKRVIAGDLTAPAGRRQSGTACCPPGSTSGASRLSASHSAPSMSTK